MTPEFSLPSKTSAIFDWLSKGYFLSQNSKDQQHRTIYRITDQHFELLKAYFQPLGFQLERGRGYFFFSQKETRSTVEDKLEKLFRHLDFMELLMAIDPHLSIGKVQQTQTLLHTIQQNPRLRDKLRKMSVKGGEDLSERLRNTLKNMERESWLEWLDEEGKHFMLLDSFDYLIQMVQTIYDLNNSQSSE